jgi:hypothetical protein
VQRATAQPNTGYVRDYIFAETPPFLFSPIFQAGWSD